MVGRSRRSRQSAGMARPPARRRTPPGPSARRPGPRRSVWPPSIAEALAGDPGGLGAAQVAHAGGDVVDRAEPAERHLREVVGLHLSSSTSGAARSVGTSPGRTALTRTPARPSSSAALRTSVSRPALLTQYAAMNGCVSGAAIDEMATIGAATRAGDRRAGVLDREERAGEVRGDHEVPGLDRHGDDRSERPRAGRRRRRCGARPAPRWRTATAARTSSSRATSHSATDRGARRRPSSSATAASSALLAATGERHRRAIAEASDRARQPDAAAAAGDERGLTGERNVHGHVPSRLLPVRAPHA